MAVPVDEGVVKFHADHAPSPPVLDETSPLFADLSAWRTRLFDLALVGQDPARYGGAGFGNLSALLPDRSFVVTGTQTGAARVLPVHGWVRVLAADVARNRVRSHGPVAPSSESMTHAAVYDAFPDARFVFHVHAPGLWRAAARLGLPCTGADVAYGTPEMARDVARLARAGELRLRRVFAMPGHEDGVVSFGATADDAGDALLRAFEAARRP